MKTPARYFILMTAFCIMACGSGAPSDAQIAAILKRDFKKLEKASLNFTKASLEDIHIGDKIRVDESSPGTYLVQVTATVTTRIGGINAVRPCSTTIKLKMINNRWTLVD